MAKMPDGFIEKAVRKAVCAYYDEIFRKGEEAGRTKWISVEKKHPDAGEWVLTYCGGYAKWFDLNKWCGDCWLKTMPITHWMPLPKPPKEDV